jgi:O-antigen/teichoic acid export membrane protein
MKNNYLNVALIMGSWLIAWALNYAYYPLLLQYMSLEDFGIFGSIMGILNLIWVVTTGIVLFLNKEVSRNIENPSQIKQIYLSALLILSSLWLIWFIVFWLMSPLFAAYFNISEISYFWLVWISIIIALANSAIMATLRGMKKFSYLSCNQILSPILKLTVWVWFVYLWFSILGAIAW